MLGPNVDIAAFSRVHQRKDEDDSEEEDEDSDLEDAEIEAGSYPAVFSRFFHSFSFRLQRNPRQSVECILMAFGRASRGGRG